MGKLLEELLEAMEETDAAAWRRDDVWERVQEMDALLHLVPQVEAGLTTLQDMRAMAQVHVEMQTAMSRIAGTQGHAAIQAQADAMERLLRRNIARESQRLVPILAHLVPTTLNENYFLDDEQRRQRRTSSINWDLE